MTAAIVLSNIFRSLAVYDRFLKESLPALTTATGALIFSLSSCVKGNIVRQRRQRCRCTAFGGRMRCGMLIGDREIEAPKLPTLEQTSCLSQGMPSKNRKNRLLRFPSLDDQIRSSFFVPRHSGRDQIRTNGRDLPGVTRRQSKEGFRRTHG
jgi:hypothetical protein